jgi:hypothetical protein
LGIQRGLNSWTSKLTTCSSVAITRHQRVIIFVIDGLVCMQYMYKLYIIYRQQ